MHVKVDSTAIRSITYDEDKKILTIEFISGNSYDYPDVPQFEVNNLVAAKSVGQYFNSNIRKYAKSRS